MNERPTLLKNSGARGNWLAVTLTGTKSNRSAIGARVTIEAGGRKQMSEVVGGGSYYSQNSLTQYFGLGKAAQVDSIIVRWPNGESQMFKGVSANRTILITEGRETPVTAAPRPAGTPKQPSR